MSWTECSESRPFAAKRLVCFPHAGGSSYFFRDWRKGLPEFEVHAVCYPGRADRFGEPTATDLVAMAGEIAEAVKPLLDRPTVLFGHSMGAAVAYETARALEADGVRPAHLFVSGAPASNLVRSDARAAGANEESVIAALTALGGTDAELLDHPMFRELILPYIQADFRLLGSYEHRPGALLGCPVTAVAGADDPRVTPEQVARWASVTEGAFRQWTVPGGHFYLTDAPPYELVREAHLAPPYEPVREAHLARDETRSR
ncbi:Surfactin synthase thioesterase subunit [Streptomyces sp. Ag82_O1-12]|uniref:thioesterase II family protein n=1 Tax=Streptomyces TaxID=1883 RepID=UPI000BD42D3C|nr:MULTISPECIES: alpha/beta fold hydrolase [unclassified Streptomyces]SMQ18924.1 Surfactin synthase thioesterase subunit [Streptomyces sp. Ag82_O1-12]SOD47964.1 Surfactin synthase thioesterase subunit [Streptomyces sp. Ag82_G6-1]